MSKKISLIVSLVLFIFVPLLLAAQPTSAAKLRHADKNKDGIVDKKEMRMEKQWEKRQEKKEELMQEVKQEKKADTDNNTVISAKEKRLGWKYARSKVNTPYEARFDKNGDGWLDAAEAREFLKRRWTIIQTQGRVKADSAIEKAYDTNNDGRIDAEEAKQLKEDIIK